MKLTIETTDLHEILTICRALSLEASETPARWTDRPDTHEYIPQDEVHDYKPQDEAPVLDSAGLPWDARIHSAAKSFVSDGTWRKRRGVEAEIESAVLDELKATVAAHTIPSPPADSVPFPAFIQRLSAALSSGKLTHEHVNAVCALHAIPTIPMLVSRPDLIPAFIDELGL